MLKAFVKKLSEKQYFQVTTQTIFYLLHVIDLLIPLWKLPNSKLTRGTIGHRMISIQEFIGFSKSWSNCDTISVE